MSAFSDRPQVLFVGAFEPPRGSSIRGGQLAACRAILRSPVSEHVEWILLESMMESIPPPPVGRRAQLAFGRTFRFCRLLLTRPVDIVLIFTSNELSLIEKGCMALIARIARKRVILCPRSGFLIHEYRQRGFTRFWLRLIVRRSSFVVCQGRRWREFFSAIGGKETDKLPIIPNIVEPHRGGPLPLPNRQVATTALMMGWVEKNKGIFDLVEVVDRFRPELEGMRFVVCGKGQDWDRLTRELELRGLEEYFELRGWVNEEERNRALAEADMCLMLSHSEGLPNALLEAMAAGRPTVATAVGAVPDVIAEGRNGFLCEPGDVEEIGFRIVLLRKNLQLRISMGNEAYRFVQNELTPARIAAKWLELMQP